MSDIRPPEAPEWIAAPLPGDPPLLPPAEPAATPPAAAPVASANPWSRWVIAAAVVLAMLGAVAGGALTQVFQTKNTNASAPVTTPSRVPGFGPFQQRPSTNFGGNSNGTTTASVPAGIVDIETSSTINGLEGAGTGMILTATGDVLTNNHVIEGATRIVVTRTDNGATYNATVIGTDATEDVALLHLADAKGLPTIPIGDSSKVGVNDSVIAAGNALGRGGAPTVVTGTVRALNQSITVSDEVGNGSATLHGLIQTDAPLVPGDSGGPMFDDHNKVIGINTAAAQGRFRQFQDGSGGGEGFAVPINTAMGVVSKIRQGVETDTIHIGVRGFLGVSTTDADNGAGALVGQVQPGSPADTAGLAAGDVITAVDGSAVADANSLTDRIHGHKPGDTITLQWTTSAGISRSAKVTLSTGAAD
ncbi:MAG TPA: trypsin-like peptidase domain-containing protein [Acidimicrobiales bacterium]|nr:trypsin-like peptidase domain-containing protein [Acidimicrobiales bacterium]